MPEHPAFADFAAAVERRLENGREVYGDRSFDLASPRLLDEVLEELADVAGWSFILWCRMRRLEAALPAKEERQNDNHERPTVEDRLADVESSRILGGEVAVERAAQERGENQRRRDHHDGGDTNGARIGGTATEHEGYVSPAASGLARRERDSDAREIGP